MQKRWISLLALAIAMPVNAQEMDHGEHPPLVPGVKALHDNVKGWVIRAAEQVSEADYAFKPTPEVRSFGQLIGHIANAGYLFCSAGLGETAPTRPNAEELATKAELVAAVKAMYQYCDRAYAIDHMSAMQPATVFGQAQTRLYALEFNVAHNFEHYGNIVTYMRMNGLVPPSSGGGGEN
jgi:uncharacterized damage-inducible protein DinB